MNIKPLERSFAPAVLKPNPMWIPTKEDRVIIENILFPVKTSDGRPFLFGAADFWDSHLDIGKRNIRVLATMGALRPKRAVVSLHIETTVMNSSFIDSNGNSLSVIGSENKPFRQYFDGFAFETRDKTGHVAAACVDYDEQKIWLQDPQGIPVKAAVSQTFKEVFPDYDVEDLMLWQQRDSHSCSILTLYNMECFFKGVVPAEHVDVSALRARYLTVLDDYERERGISPKESAYYAAPVHTLRYTPV